MQLTSLYNICMLVKQKSDVKRKKIIATQEISSRCIIKLVEIKVNDMHSSDSIMSRKKSEHYILLRMKKVE